MASKQIFCSGCQGFVDARLADGKEIYPHRSDLFRLPFWKCDECKNYVGCHHKTNDPTKPLGPIPTPELRKARGHIHKILDPIWKKGKMKRGNIYKKLATMLNITEYHTAELTSVEDARRAYLAVLQLRKSINFPLSQSEGEG